MSTFLVTNAREKNRKLISYWTNARARAFEVRRGRQSFLSILAPEKHAVHNAITNLNNSLMQSEIILIGVTQQEGLGERCELSKWGSRRSHGSQTFSRFYIASNPSKAVKNIV